MPDLRSNPRAPIYDVVQGDKLDHFWGKKLQKISKHFPNDWYSILRGLIDEYKVFDLSKIIGGAKYNLLACSSDRHYLFYKIEIKFYPNVSASKGACRAGVFVVNGQRVVIAFVGLHEHINASTRANSDKARMMEILKREYKELYDLLEER